MSFRFILDQLASAAGGYALGLLTAIWLHALWKWRHPETIRYWGTWYTNPQTLTVVGIALLVGWAMFLLKSAV